MDATPAEPLVRRHALGSRGRDLALLMAASFCYLAGPMAIAPIVAGFAGSLGANEVLMGVAGGLMNLVALASRPFVGRLADRLDKRRLTALGAAVMALAALAYVPAVAPWMVLAARVAQGLGYAVCSVCLSTWISELLPRERVGEGMGLYGMMTALGMAVGPALGIYCYQLLGYRVAFAAAALLLALTFLCATRVRRPGAHPRRAFPGGAAPGVLEWRVVPVALIMMLFTIPFTATQTFLVTLTEAEGLDLPVGLFFPIYAALLLVLRATLRRRFDRWPFRRFLAGAMLCAAGALLALTFMRGGGLMVLGALCMAGSYGIMCSVCQSTAILLAHPGCRGLANGTYYVGIDLGMALGPLIGGVLLGHAPPRAFYPALLAVLPLMLLTYLIGRRLVKGL